MRKFFKEFKEFINRGNVLDLAVAVIIGGAFSAIVTSLTNKVIMPLINLLLAGQGGLESAYTILRPVYEEDGITLDLAKSIYIDWGAFITAIIDFLLIALVVFVIVKIFNASAKRLKVLNGLVKDMTKKELKEEREKVKALAKEQKRSFAKVWKEHKNELEAEKKKQQEEEQKKKEEEERLNNPSERELLKQIRDLLLEKK